MRLGKGIPNISGYWEARIKSGDDIKLVKINVIQKIDNVIFNGRNYLLDESGEENEIHSQWVSDNCIISDDGMTITYNYKKTCTKTNSITSGVSAVKVVGSLKSPDSLEGNYADTASENAGALVYRRPQPQ